MDLEAEYDKEGLKECGDQIQLVMEKLDSLRELRDHQHSLQHTCGQLECCYHEYKECHALEMQCTAELSKLEGERSYLQERLKQIDHDITQLTGLKKELEEVSMQCATSAPTDMYKKMKEQVNEERRTLGMAQFPDCEAYSQLSDCKCRVVQSSKNRRHQSYIGTPASKVHISSKQTIKAGPSYKQCPGCDQVVSRNAVTCPRCHTLCSRPGHSTGKKHRRSTQADS